MNKTLRDSHCSYRTRYALCISLLVLRPNTRYMPKHQYSLVFYIKDKVATRLSPPDWIWFTMVNDFRSNGNILHLFINWILPRSVTIILTNLLYMLNSCSNFDTIHICRFPSPWIYCKNNYISIPQYIMEPPKRFMFIFNIPGLCRFIKLNYVRLFE